ncbi:MAG: MurR/RpiR family transcriptional regulator [Phycisphaerales bacterium]
MSIQDLIASVNDRLTPTDRRIAEVVLADPSLLAFGTVAELADRVRTSPPSIVRFAAKLGFDGYRDLQANVQASVQARLADPLSRPSERIRRTVESLTPVREAIEDTVHRTFLDLDPARLEALAAPIVRARGVWILSGETSMAGAHVLCSGLRMIRPNVVLVDAHSTGRDLCSAGPGDVAIVIDFARYRRNAIAAARTLAELGVDIVAITDGPLSPLASITETWCGLNVPAVGPFDSSVPAVTAAELLVARVAHDLGDAARERIDQLESMWEATGTFLESGPRPSDG